MGWGREIRGGGGMGAWACITCLLWSVRGRWWGRGRWWWSGSCESGCFFSFDEAGGEGRHMLGGKEVERVGPAMGVETGGSGGLHVGG